MSYTNNPLAEILYALANPDSKESQAYRQFAQPPPPPGPPPFQYPRGGGRGPSPYGFYGYEQDDEEEDDDDAYYTPGYPAYYPLYQDAGRHPLDLPFGFPLGFPPSGGPPPPPPPPGQPAFHHPGGPRNTGRSASQLHSFQQQPGGQRQSVEVNDILNFLNGRGRGRKPSDAGADLDAEVAAALRKELESKEGQLTDKDRHPSEVAILEALKQDIARLEGKEQFEAKFEPDIKEEAEPEEGDSDTINFSARTTAVPPPSFFPGTPSASASGGPTDTSGKLETPKQSKVTINTPTQHPLVRRHSNKTSKDPKPKIEVSQRNIKNPKIPYSPSVNIYDTKEDYNIVLAIPGASLEELDIDFHPVTNEIVIKGEINNIVSLEDKSLKHSEIRTGSIERRVKFPSLPKIDDEKIKAKYLNGLLTIKIPKNSDESLNKPKRKVTIEDVPDEELEYEEHGGVVV